MFINPAPPSNVSRIPWGWGHPWLRNPGLHRATVAYVTCEGSHANPFGGKILLVARDVNVI